MIARFGPVVATAAFAFYALTGFTPLIDRNERTDERDRAIARRATLAGAMASYLAFISGCMGTWLAVFAFQHEQHVRIHVLGTITMLGAIVFFFTRSVAVLVLYGRYVEADDD